MDSQNKPLLPLHSDADLMDEIHYQRMYEREFFPMRKNKFGGGEYIAANSHLCFKPEKEKD